MKIKALYIITGVLLITTISLSICLVIQKPVCERIHLDNVANYTERMDSVPDSETAKKIADIILEANSRFEPIYNYDDYQVNFIEQDNLWEVEYYPSLADGIGAVDFSIVLYIRKDNAMIV